ncbi:hypothetical protein B0H66DRAFT_627200 [Apodospora peruviana]|uniref:SET domain-containing protein n=1 Tax=Apodospora peruviana TaxID=516989 RepID=A0AAE0HXA3_9PEZI|nr:hypothetical protein B0H66DRAFT_627200 [Apodospora peruviana]
MWNNCHHLHMLRQTAHRVLVLLLLSTTRAVSFVVSDTGFKCYGARGNLFPRWYGTCPSPTDEGSWQPSSSSSEKEEELTPWTHTPYCAEDHLSHKLCVFTSATSGTIGTSLITTPQISASVAGRLIDSRNSGHIHVLDPPSPSYEVADIPGKGKGVVATKIIRAHETIMVDYPAIIADKEIGDFFAQTTEQDLKNRAVRQLRDPYQVLNLSTGNRYPAGDDSIAEAVLAMNAFDLNIDDVGYAALYPNVSRINHACTPNSYVATPADGLSLAVVAVRDILPGEEISISYILPSLPSHARQTILKQKWAFDCTCSLCKPNHTASPASSIEESDERRNRIMKLTDEVDALLADYYRDTDDDDDDDGDTVLAAGRGDEALVREAIRLTHLVLNLLEEEGLMTWTQLAAEQHAVLAESYKSVGENAMARQHARKVLDDRHGGKDLKGFIGTLFADLGEIMV